jgi:hypothetical protein
MTTATTDPSAPTAPAPPAQAPAAPARSSLLTLLLLAVAALLLYAQARRYYPFFVDDGFISLRYSKRLLDGHGLTWTDGERVEGYSNLLWVLGCAALGLVRHDLVWCARALGVASTLATFGAVAYRYVARAVRSALPGAAGLLALALAGPVCIWSIGGLEQPLVAALLAWSAVLLYPLLAARGPITLRDAVPAGVCLGLLSITRPDTGLFTAVACLALLVSRGRAGLRDGLRSALVVGALATSFFLVQLAFRRAYYGEWVANTALAKVSFASRRVAEGARVLGEGAMSLWPVGVPALGLGVAAFVVPGSTEAAEGRRARIGLLLLALVVWSAYVVAIGSDNFPAHRSVVPDVVLLGLLLAESVAWALESTGRLGTFAPTLVAGCLAVFGNLQQSDPGNVASLIPTPRVMQGRTTGLLLKKAFGAMNPPPLLAVDAAGVVPFYAELPALDMLGLCDSYLTHHRPKSFGNGPIGHELGDGDYVLGRSPDLILSGIGGATSLSYAGGRQMAKDARFVDGYLLTNIAGTDPTPVSTYLFVKKDGKAGIQRAPGRVVLPGLFFAIGQRVRKPGTPPPLAGEQFEASVDDAGVLGTVVPAGNTARYSGLRLEPGRWHVELASTGGAARVDITPGLEDVVVGTTSADFDVKPSAGAEDGAVAIAVRTFGAPARVNRVTFTRL